MESEIQFQEFTIRPYQSGDEVKINDQFNKVFRINRSLKEWNWKFESPNDSLLLLAFDRLGNLVSHYGIVTDIFKYEDQVVRAGHSVDSFSVKLPRAVSARLFEKLVEHFYNLYGGTQGVSLMYGFPGARKLRLGRIRLDYGRPFPVRYWEKEVSKDKWWERKISYKMSAEISEILTDELWSRSRVRYAVGIERNFHWFYKRYLSRPNHPYFIFKYLHSGFYTCISVCTFQGENLVLVDLVWDGKSKRHLHHLVRHMNTCAFDHGIHKMSMWLSGDSMVEELFTQWGWVIKKEPQDLHLVVKSFDSDIDRNELLNRFYLTKGCTDII